MRKRTFALSICGILLVGLASAEWLVRMRAHSRYGEFLDIYDFHEPVPELDILIPSPNLSIEFAGQTHIDTDSHGFRSPELEHPKPAGSLRIAFLGGSTSFCSQASSNESTWPHLVTDKLRADLTGLEVEYLNAGVTGYRTTHSTRNMRARVAPLKPDLVIIYHGTNDLAVDSKELAIAAGLASTFEPSWLADNSLLWHLIQKNRRWMASQSAGKSNSDKLELDVSALAEVFRTHLTQLVQTAQAGSQLVALVTFSAKVRREQALEVQLENLQQSFSFMSYLSSEDIMTGYEAYNRVIEEVATQTGALLIPAADAIPPDAKHFADSVHLTDAGCEALAIQVHATLKVAPRLQELIARLKTD